MTPHEAAREMRERAAQLLEETMATYNEGLSAIDVRLSYTQNLKWPNGRRAAAAIRALPLPDPQPDPRDAAALMRPFWEAMRAKAVIGDIHTADDFYEIVHKLDLKRVLDAVDALKERLELSLTVELTNETTKDLLAKLLLSADTGPLLKGPTP